MSQKSSLQISQNSRSEQAIAAMAASTMVSLTMTPLDVIKIRQQITSKIKTNPVQILLQVYRQEGIPALWAGMVPRLTLGALFSAFYFPMYEALRDGAYKLSGSEKLSAPIAGGFARFISVVVTNPVEVTTVGMQADSKEKFMKILTQKVLRDRKIYFSGVGQTIARDVPFSMLYWGMNEPLRNNILPKYSAFSEDKDFGVLGNVLGPFLKSFVSGAVAGCCSAMQRWKRKRVE